MYERCTDGVKRALVKALEEARSLGHGHLGTEHFLLGLVAIEPCPATRVLTALEISPESLREHLIAALEPAPRTPVAHQPFTRAAEKALDRALRAGLALGVGRVGTEHLLLGVAREGSGVAGRVLAELGAGPDAVERAVAALNSTPGPRYAGSRDAEAGPRYARDMSDVAADAAYRRFLNDTHVQLQHHVEAREREVTSTRSFVTGLVPGLLQVPDYAAGVFEKMAALMGFGPQETGPEAVAARMNRQRVLDDEGKRFDYLIPEAALYVPVCAPEAMRAQLDRLIATLGRPNVRLGLIPLHAQVELVPFHGFTICDDELVQIEMFTGQLTLTGDDDVRLHRAAFERLACSAVYDEQARALLEAVHDRIS